MLWLWLGEVGMGMGRTWPVLISLIFDLFIFLYHFYVYVGYMLCANINYSNVYYQVWIQSPTSNPMLISMLSSIRSTP